MVTSARERCDALARGVSTSERQLRIDWEPGDAYGVLVVNGHPKSVALGWVDLLYELRAMQGVGRRGISERE